MGIGRRTDPQARYVRPRHTRSHRGLYNTVGGQQIASEYVYDATNFRLGEVSVSYTLRNLFKGAIKGLTVSAVGRNLFFIYKDCPSDPDIALSTKNGLGAFDIFNMPSARSYGFNLKLEF